MKPFPYSFSLRPFRLFLGATVAAAMHAAAIAQNVPIVNTPPSSPGFHLPDLAGSLTFAVSASENIAIGYNGSNANDYATAISGDVAYISSSAHHPFSAVYSGGYLGSTSGLPSSFFQNLGLSQVLDTGHLHLVVSDSVSYLPDNPVDGLSGVAGVGDLGINPVQVSSGDIGSLQSNYVSRVSNTVSASAGYPLSGKTSLGASGAYFIQRITGNQAGFDNNEIRFSGGLNRQLTPLSTVSVNYGLDRFTYPGYDYGTTGQSGTLEWTRQWTRTFHTDVGAGPQYITRVGLPGVLSYTISTSATYLLKRSSLSAGFYRALNGGGGVTTTVESNAASVTYSRGLGSYAGLSTYFSYVHSSSELLAPQQFSGNAIVGGIQLSRSLTRNISVYGSYNAQHQTTTNGYLAINALNGITQTVGFGLTYSPKQLLFGR